MRVTAGGFRHRVDLQSATITQDTAGQPVETWATTYASVPMQLMETPSGNESIEGKEMIAGQAWKMRIRYRASVTPAWRLTWNSVTYHLISVVDPDGMSQVLDLVATK